MDTELHVEGRISGAPEMEGFLRVVLRESFRSRSRNTVKVIFREWNTIEDLGDRGSRSQKSLGPGHPESEGPGTLEKV